MASFYCSVPVTAASGQTTDGVTLFQDNFESGKADTWTMQAGWTVKRDGENFVLSGSGAGIALLQVGGHWTDYRLKLRVKVLRRGVNLWYRWGDEGAYVISIGKEGASLGKQAPRGKDCQNLASQHDRCEFGTWHNVEIRVVGANVKFYLDGDLRLDHTDDRPLERGTIAFQTPFQDCHVHIDDVKVSGTMP